MSWKRESVSMPSTNAGILGISANERLSGIQMDPKTIVIGIVVLIVLIKVLDHLVVFG
ncbi:MAG: hypothetical protein WC501_01845 [Candidatus Micrarchaeia archaeon]